MVEVAKLLDKGREAVSPKELRGYFEVLEAGMVGLVDAVITRTYNSTWLRRAWLYPDEITREWDTEPLTGNWTTFVIFH